MTLLNKYKFSILYLISICIVTVLFVHYPLLINITDTIQITPWTVLVGLWFVLRDYSQREIGHYVFIPMTLGVIIGAIINPAIAVATILASGASEFVDWVIYTFTKKPFHQRIILSSLISAPTDTIIFFAAFDYFGIIPGVSIFNWPTVILAIISKLIAALIIFYYYKNRKL